MDPAILHAKKNKDSTYRPVPQHFSLELEGLHQYCSITCELSLYKYQILQLQHQLEHKMQRVYKVLSHAI